MKYFESNQNKLLLSSKYLNINQKKDTTRQVKEHISNPL